MLILIDNKRGVPIYEQIFTQIKEQIMSGALRADSPLPSIRNLAKDLQISVITTKRAYDELEKEGYLYTLPGKGCFVTENAKEIVNQMKREKLDVLSSLVKELATAGTKKEDILGIINSIYND